MIKDHFELPDGTICVNETFSQPPGGNNLLQCIRDSNGNYHRQTIMTKEEWAVYSRGTARAPFCSDCHRQLRVGEMVYLTLGGLLQHAECMTAEQRKRAKFAPPPSTG